MTEPRDGANVRAPSQLEDPRSNADLLLRTRDGDPAAWEEVVRRYSGVVFGKVRAFGLQEADALDAVQMTWLRLIENAHRVQFAERLGQWLATTASRQCLRILRQAKSTQDIEMVADTVADPSMGPEQRVIDADTARTLWKVVAELSPRRRTLLRALFIDGHPRPYTEVARIAGIPPGAIGPMRTRALRQLRDKLDECDLGPGADVAEDVETEPTEGYRTGSYLLDDLLDKAEQELQERLESKVADLRTGNSRGTGDAQLDDLLGRADAALRVFRRDHGTAGSGFLLRILDDFAGGVLVLRGDPRVGRSGQPDEADDITTKVVGTPDVATEDPVDDPSEHSPLLPTLPSAEACKRQHEVLRLFDRLPPRQRQGLAGALDGYTPEEIAAELTALR